MHLSQGILKYHMFMKQDDPRITLGNLGPGNQKYKSIQVIHSMYFVRVNLLCSLLPQCSKDNLYALSHQLHELINEAFICIKFAGFLHAQSFTETFDVTILFGGSSTIKHCFTRLRPAQVVLTWV